MSRLNAFFLGMIFGGLGVYGSLNYHFLRTNDGMELVPKVASGFSETYLDVREFSPADWADHKAVLTALVRADKEHVLRDSAAENLAEGVKGVLADLGLGSDR